MSAFKDLEDCHTKRGLIFGAAEFPLTGRKCREEMFPSIQGRTFSQSPLLPQLRGLCTNIIGSASYHSNKADTLQQSKAGCRDVRPQSSGSLKGTFQESTSEQPFWVSSRRSPGVPTLHIMPLCGLTGPSIALSKCLRPCLVAGSFCP